MFAIKDTHERSIQPHRRHHDEYKRGNNKRTRLEIYMVSSGIVSGLTVSQLSPRHFGPPNINFYTDTNIFYQNSPCSAENVVGGDEMEPVAERKGRDADPTPQQQKHSGLRPGQRVGYLESPPSTYEVEPGIPSTDGIRGPPAGSHCWWLQRLGRNFLVETNQQRRAPQNSTASPLFDAGGLRKTSGRMAPELRYSLVSLSAPPGGKINDEKLTGPLYRDHDDITNDQNRSMRTAYCVSWHKTTTRPTRANTAVRARWPRPTPPSALGTAAVRGRGRGRRTAQDAATATGRPPRQAARDGPPAEAARPDGRPRPWRGGPSSCSRCPPSSSSGWGRGGCAGA